MDSVSYAQLLRWDGKNWQLKSLEDLTQENIIYSWFQYRQIADRWKIDRNVGLLREDENFFKQVKDQKRAHIKRIYGVLVELDSEPELIKECMIKWAQNFGEPVLLDTWETIWVRNVKFTQAQNLRENFYKMFYRWHLDPQKMSRMYPDLQPKCWRCGCLDATYYHIWWSCKNIKAFWIKIWWNIQRIFRRRVKFTPQLFLLGTLTDCDNKEVILMLNLITAARLLVGQYWKKESLPTLQEWFLIWRKWQRFRLF